MSPSRMGGTEFLCYSTKTVRKSNCFALSSGFRPHLVTDIMVLYSGLVICSISNLWFLCIRDGTTIKPVFYNSMRFGLSYRCNSFHMAQDNYIISLP